MVRKSMCGAAALSVTVVACAALAPALQAAPAPRAAAGGELRGPVIVEYVPAGSALSRNGGPAVGTVFVTLRTRHAIPGAKPRGGGRLSATHLGASPMSHADYSVTSRHCYEAVFRGRWKHGGPRRTTVTLRGLAGGGTVRRTVRPRPLTDPGGAVKRLGCFTPHFDD
ncbi:hypothetical protein [Patulibacter sp. SYSU D01012]|uniref:hypothetical protein n=1 Tax=Patulibacter sp. SYSU D01012 TaxID=2817381 RepID=UPI001B305420|nr:hypothetical protein [Patulibacter sp. SYSU D01012]